MWLIPHEERHGGAGSDIPAAVESHITANHLLREPPLPRESAIPYLGDLAIYEQVIRCVAKGRIAINVAGHWYHKEPGESTEDAVRRLRQKA
jgi:hypothetical protein